ncbi:MAG: hypothetical protein RMJ37_02000 [Spirochaetia bacterium]|nr:hypothetical protein [Spirochaetota bacterium]MCX8097134.1 hypothetical protein [Spirochaetota bacterium]MDW8112097.1 hypothetical protein [Spirochaetia bacterium]
MTLGRLSYRQAKEVVKIHFGIDIHISNIHYRLRSLGKLRDMINEKILEMGMRFLRKAGVRRIVIDGTDVGYNTPITMRVFGGMGLGRSRDTSRLL